jgi:hypothetical protein
MDRDEALQWPAQYFWAMLNVSLRQNLKGRFCTKKKRFSVEQIVAVLKPGVPRPKELSGLRMQPLTYSFELLLGYFSAQA